MESQFSIIKFVNNPISNEYIALGLIMVSEGNIYFKMSEEKLEFVKKLNSKAFKLLEFSLKQFSKFVGNDLYEQDNLLIRSNKKISSEYLNRLSIYNNGILQFSIPSSIDSEINNQIFNEYFSKFIGVDRISNVVQHVSTLRKAIQEKLYQPLQGKVDIDYTLKKKQLPTLFFDFHFESLGVNGSLYASKAIDFNSNRQLGQIRTDISEFESVIERLNIFANQRGLNADHKYYLIADPYLGNVPSYNDLYSLLKQDNMPFFNILSTKEIKKLVKQVIDSKARKFSEELYLTD